MIGTTWPLWYGKDGKAITAEEWGKTCQGSDRIVARTVLPDGAIISTVLLGLDHGRDAKGLPLIFETMVFPGAGSYAGQDMDRYATLDEARAGHERIAGRWRRRSGGNKNEIEEAGGASGHRGDL